MKPTKRTVAAAALALLMTAVSAMSSVLAADSSATVGSDIALSGEVAVQYGQSSGTIQNVDGDTDVCVPWVPLHGDLTGNAFNGYMHCHSLINKPTAIGVYPLGAPTSKKSRVLMNIASVGNKGVHFRGIVDTGSAGLTLNAFQIFPPDMISPKGFVFPAGQDQINYRGIIVTKLTATRGYGGADGTQRTGNLGFAQVSFGDRGELRTAVIPILFVFSSTAAPISKDSGDASNTIGINGELAPVGQDLVVQQSAATGANGAAPGSALNPYPICTVQSTTACSLMSPLRGLSYVNVKAGFLLKSFPLNNCTTDPNYCDGRPGNYLVVGLDETVAGGFSTEQLRCATVAAGVESCDKAVPNLAITVSGETGTVSNIAVNPGQFTGGALFDTGTPVVQMRIPFPATGSPSPVSGQLTGGTVDITFPSKIPLTDKMTAAEGYDTVNFAYVVPKSQYSTIGIGFFTRNSMFLDYDNGIEGWKASDASGD